MRHDGEPRAPGETGDDTLDHSTLRDLHEEYRTIRVIPHLIGVISDTHGLLRPEALAALAGELILHAGGVGSPEVGEHQLARQRHVVVAKG